MPHTVAETITVADVNAAAERLWPLSGAEGWDAPGLLSGNPAATVTAIHLAVDAVPEVADEAIVVGANLLLVQPGNLRPDHLRHAT